MLQARAAGKPPMEGENLIKPLISSAFEKVRVITSRMCPLICVWWAEKCLRGILMRPPLCPPLQIHSILLETDYYKIDPALHRLHDRLVHVIQGKPLIHGGRPSPLRTEDLNSLHTPQRSPRCPVSHQYEWVYFWCKYINKGHVYILPEICAYLVFLPTRSGGTEGSWRACD